MSGPSWQISGSYFEACSCDYLCPCVPTSLTARPTKGSCDHTPGVMADGNWTVGIITDDRATPDQREALVKIAGGQAGGPLAQLIPLIGTFAGVEVHPIRFEQSGMRRSVSVPGGLEMAIEGVPGADQSQPMSLDNVGHPAATRLALAKGSGARLHAFGIDWEDAGGKNNGHYAPFSWKSD